VTGNDKEPTDLATPPPAAADLDDPRVVRALEEYLAALEEGRRPDREAFLARNADIAPALAECLDGMDVLHRGEFAPPPAEKPAAAAAEGLSGAPLGDFRLVREIGRGGMGVVYEAEQLSLGRTVALKVLPFAAALDARQLRRFKNEAQAAAHLHHPHIVPVYGVGVERGVHFYAMQLIEGQNLAALVAELRGEAGLGGPSEPGSRRDDQATGPYQAPPDPALLPSSGARTPLGGQLTTLRSRRAGDFFRTIVRLTVQAAEALDFAHGVGVVHRDVKPANLLVDGRGEVWVTDFGLAQFQADAGLTQTGDLLGTLRYMSPEQAGGQRVLIDHRTDVYSLGATLYELLTLRPIFDGTDRQRLLHQIVHEEPKPPRAVERSIPPELETIVLKAVAKAPADRYATAGELAADLQRFLRHEPIRARRETVVQRGRKWLRRHPAVPVTAAVLLVMLTASSLAAAWVIGGEQEKTLRANAGLQREKENAEKAKEDADRAAERERQRAEEAEQRFKLAQASADEMIELSEQELIDNPFMTGLRKRLLESALGYYQQLIAQRHNDPAAQKELDVTRQRVQQILDDLAVLERSSRVDILKIAEVRGDLKLTGDQVDRVEDLWKRVDRQAHDTFGDFGQITAEQRRQRFLELARAKDNGVMEILTMQQFVRFGQLALQAQGLAAFHDLDIVAALKLTAEQKERLRAFESEPPPRGPSDAKPGPRGPDRGTRPGGPDKRPGPGGADKEPASPGGSPKQTDPDQRSPEEKYQAAQKEKFLAELTDEQRRRWKDLTGEPFKGSLRPPPPFGHFGPPHP
jgi:serine/threonine protein kinase